MPSNFDIAYGMLRREAENLLGAVGLDVHGNPLGRMAWENMLRKYDGPIRSFIGLMISEPPESVDAGCEVIREELDSRVSGLAEKMKQKIQRNKEQ